MKRTSADSLGRERHDRCNRLLAECECITIPPGGFTLEATPEQVMGAACPLCHAAPDEPCDGSYFKWFILGIFVKGLPRVHTRRYQAAINAKADVGAHA